MMILVMLLQVKDLIRQSMRIRREVVITTASRMWEVFRFWGINRKCPLSRKRKFIQTLGTRSGTLDLRCLDVVQCSLYSKTSKIGRRFCRIQSKTQHLNVVEFLKIKTSLHEGSARARASLSLRIWARERERRGRRWESKLRIFWDFLLS